jgi:hypothetical protein
MIFWVSGGESLNRWRGLQLSVLLIFLDWDIVTKMFDFYEFMRCDTSDVLQAGRVL